MTDETSIAEELGWQYEAMANVVAKKLSHRFIKVWYAASCEEALVKILGLIPDGATVGRGDSLTLDQVGVLEELKRRSRNRVLDPFERDDEGYLTTGYDQERHVELERECLLSDVFLTGVNAITLDGKMVSTDATGNRVAPMLFGPKKVIVVAGANKIVKDLDEALVRIRITAAPLNARRHFVKHHAERFADLPCVKTGFCSDCNKPSRICKKTVVIEGESHFYPDRMHLVVIGKHLGI